MRLALLCLTASLAGLAACSAPEPVDLTKANSERTAVLPSQASDTYYQTAAAAVAARAGRIGEISQANNVILFVGDGMGISTVTAGRIYAGQKRDVDGESFRLAMETLPNAALSKTYAHDGQVSDSASTATALVAGVKSNVRTLGVTSEAGFGNCASAQGNGTDSLFEIAEEAGLATGIISTARITHATPASAYAESASRDWEDNTAFPDGIVPEDCRDIASQLVEWEAGDGFEIALGGGRRHFMTTDEPDPELENGTGRRTDGRDLASEWTKLSNRHRVIFAQAGFDATNFDSDEKVLGLFNPSHMEFELDRAEDGMGEPSIAEMTRAAITRLSRHEDGYVLMVEGGRIDHGHHAGNAARALEDTDAFDQAVATALEMTRESDTLIIVTADHSHTMTLAGYPARNNPILGKVVYATGTEARGADGKPYTTLGYANGPGAMCAPQADATEPCTRPDLSNTDTTQADYRQQAVVAMPSETHAGEDVAIFARGPGSQLVNGVMEQNEVFHVMGRATGLVAHTE
ncbi:MAG: alkaline phosphatase [Pseudomonadota bacterium]